MIAGAPTCGAVLNEVDATMNHPGALCVRAPGHKGDHVGALCGPTCSHPNPTPDPLHKFAALHVPPGGFDAPKEPA